MAFLQYLCVESKSYNTRYFIGYDRFLSNWELELLQCTDKLNFLWPEDDSTIKGEMTGFISPEMRHSFSKQHDLVGGGFPESVLKLNKLLDLAGESSTIKEETFVEDVERLYEEFSFYSKFILYDTNHLREMGRQLSHNDIMLKRKESQIAQLQAKIDEQQQEIGRIHEIAKGKLMRTTKQVKNKIFPVI